MSDPRFARFKTDPRFRRIKKEKQKVVVDDRFKELFEGDNKGKSKGKKGRVDKYGRPLADTHEQDNLRRFYRLEGEDEPTPKAGPDYARGEVLLESSDEDDKKDEDKQADDDESEAEGVLVLGRDVSKPIPVPHDDEDVEIDLDEDTYAELDAQVAAYAKENPEADGTAPEAGRTRRIAVVNLDWDHVRAIHLYKIFSSLVSPTAPAAASASASTSSGKGSKVKGSGTVVRGKVLSVRIYPSEFGKERMAREEKEGPPSELFRRRNDEEEEINEKTIFEVGDEDDYDEEALRKYQLERLRYYYAIVECDTVEAASHIYNELEGTELERSANVFDLSFVPDDMPFDDEPRDEANDDLSAPYRGLEFVTDALRHSKVKLTWDEDDPERVQITRRVLSRKEIEENDFRAYLASSTSGSESEAEATPKGKGKSKDVEREKLRVLLLGGDDDALPEGWGRGKDLPGGNSDGGDVDMEITFTPGLSERKDSEDETTLEKYRRKMKEKKQKRKEDVLERRKAKGGEDEGKKERKGVADDEFFAGDSEDEEGSEGDNEAEEREYTKRGKKDKSRGKGKNGRRESASPPPARHVSTAEELALVAGPSGDGASEPKHFNMKAVIKAEKGAKLKSKGKKGKKGKKGMEEENELQEDFRINVNDDRFKAVLEDHAFAIDPSNPHFKETKSMKAILEERSKRHKNKGSREGVPAGRSADKGSDDLRSLVERVKRKSAAAGSSGSGKRRKVV
ncbi:hypothetical protein DAEQUDRAFT_762639 [Daedalea quercina L-15889]|uniref:Uncharacterized protein n=1 Tax=Daedalea quercina L-15889 TaxID=1314783 RepID=A0A165T2C0_9APHY|nr:hypothetical protein DAEQUDRAFT_762639 [Daedalea quercina L-15889]